MSSARAHDAEFKNDRFKRAHHRVVARALATRPALREEALEVVQRWMTEPQRATFVEEWLQILTRPVLDIRRDITKRDPHWNRLRSSSPFALIRTKLLDLEGVAKLRRKTQ